MSRKASSRGERLDEGGGLAEDGHDLVADLAVAGEAGRDDLGLGAEADGASHRHGRAAAEGAGLVGGGGDDAAAFGGAADEDGSTAQLGAVVLLDGGVEGVHVGVDNVPQGGGMRVRTGHGATLTEDEHLFRLEARWRMCFSAGGRDAGRGG